MSKSLGNGVDLGRELTTFGVDAVRLTVVFAGPPEDDIDWADVSPAGSVKYLARVARLAEDVAALPGAQRDLTVDRAVAKAVDEVTRATEAQRLNVAVARLMELTNALRKALDSPAPAAGSLRDGAEVLAVMLGCWAPTPPRRPGRAWVTTWRPATRSTTRPGRRPIPRCWSRRR
jgi:leucyl-tRNA synthetase